MRRNAERMRELAERMRVGLRPHVKTHKCPEVAAVQTGGGPKAVTVSTLAEARAFCAAGFPDIIYAVPVEPGKFDEVFELTRACERFAVITDDLETAGALDEAARRAQATPDVFLKVDCGYHRCGVEPHSPEALTIPRLLSDSKSLRFAGILTHAGHSYHARSREELLAVAHAERDVMLELAARLRASGVDVPVVSIGSTPTVTQVGSLEGVDEVRPGNYIFFDAFQATLGSCAFDDCALTVLASVVHLDRARRRAVIDAGAIALSKDRGPVDFDAACGYGRVLDLGGADTSLRVGGLSQEHGEIVAGDSAHFDALKVGSRVRVLANHSCLTAAQHDFYHVVEGGRVVDRWEIRRGW
jgi:D-serine deaminase-like pyridoxal phosphate-dependent protein